MKPYPEIEKSRTPYYNGQCPSQAHIVQAPIYPKHQKRESRPQLDQRPRRQIREYVTYPGAKAQSKGDQQDACVGGEEVGGLEDVFVHGHQEANH